MNWAAINRLVTIGTVAAIVLIGIVGLTLG